MIEIGYRMLMRCLKIDDKWAKLIVAGKKKWEIRRTNTNIRERIAIGNTKTGCCVGYATIVDAFEMDVDELMNHNDRHLANEFIKKYARGKKTLYVWVLRDAAAESNPRSYTYSTGCWCKI